MRLRTGTSGYSYTPWKGRFYPRDLANARMLSYYAERLPAVEINSSFYRLPAASTLRGWAGQVPPEFRFALKAPRYLTHAHAFPSTDAVQHFIQRASELGDRLGPMLFQFPRGRPRDVTALAALLAPLSGDVQIAFEFRDPSWFVVEVFDTLRAAGCALCVTDTDAEPATPRVTASWLYLRLRRSSYTDAELADWARRLADLGADQAFVFFRHEDEARGPEYALKLAALAA